MIIKNTVLNAAGLVIPGLLFIPAAAFLARTLGVEQFGLLLLMYAMLGYSGIFDAGMTRAVIRKIAQSKTKDEHDFIMGTALGAVLVISAIPVFLVLFFSDDIAVWLKVSENYTADTVAGLKLLALVVPFFLITVVAFSYLEGKEEFLKLSFYKVITGAVMATAPAIAVYNDASLVSAVLGLLGARIFTAILAIFSLNMSIGIRNLKFDKKVLIDLVTFGGWISLSNIISPVMVYMDRFILSNSVGAASVAFYNAPSDLIEKISVLPGALARTIFPLFSRLGSHIEYEKKIYFGLVIVLLILLAPLFLMAESIMDLWLGEPYALQSSFILKILIIGFFFNALAQIPFAAIQAKGHSRLTALLHLTEVAPYLLLLFYLVDILGLVGAAYAWAARVIIDFFCLLFFSRRL
ncbi:oligosaccharide flippase family protein [Oceanospirillaceae bacterium ASx5O]|nr:oligosaccharide flippase family protein [Oceanospirillaceae bacterium ASx5O]